MFNTLDDLAAYIRQNGIVIPNECWQTFMTFLGTQLQAISDICPDSKIVQTDLLTKVNACLEKHIQDYYNIKESIKKLNEHPHGIFDKPMYETYLVLAYLAYIHGQTDKLTAVMLSYGIFILLVELKQRFKVCVTEYMQLALTYMSKKAVYRKYELNHVEVVKYVVNDVVKKYLEMKDKPDDFVFRMLRLILARITQNVKTLANAYYKAAQNAKQNYSYGTNTEISTQSLFQSIMLHIDSAKSTIPSIKSQLSITLDDETLECVLDSITGQTIRQFISILLHKNESFRKLFTDTKTCNSLRTLYNKIFHELHYLNEFDAFYQNLIKQCPKLTDYYRLQVRKIIAMIVTIAWKMSVCQ